MGARATAVAFIYVLVGLLEYIVDMSLRSSSRSWYDVKIPNNYSNQYMMTVLLMREIVLL